MLKMTLRLGLGVMVAAALSACGSVNLIDLNNNFAQLSAQAADAERRHDGGALNDVEHESLIEVNRQSFAENGDMAVEAAGEADSPRSKASFLNVAVRSYLQSGAVGDSKIPDLVDQGLEACKDPSLQGLDGLPVTCGYFHLAIPQAINNETLRSVEALNRKAVAKQVSGGPRPLSAADGQALNEAFDRFLAQIEAIEAAREKIALGDADPRFAQAIQRQKQIFFCNAFSTLALFGRAESGPDWDREAARSAAQARSDAAEGSVGIETPSAECRNLSQLQ